MVHNAPWRCSCQPWPLSCTLERSGRYHLYLVDVTVLSGMPEFLPDSFTNTTRTLSFSYSFDVVA